MADENKPDEKPKAPEVLNSLSDLSDKESKKEEKPSEKSQEKKLPEEKTQDDKTGKDEKSDEKKQQTKDEKKAAKEKKKKSSKNKAPKKRSSKSQQSKKKKHRSKDRRSKEEPANKKASSPDASDSGGETLAPCSEKEWEGAQAAYNAALLNVKRKPNRVTVFALKKKGDKDSSKSPVSPKSQDPMVNGLRSVSPDKIKLKKKKKSREPMDRADHIGKIVAGIVRKYLEGKPEDNIQVEIKLVANDGITYTPVIP